MNNDNSLKLLLFQENKNGSNKNNKNLIKERNPKAKMDLNLSNYFKLIKHKEKPYIKDDKSKNYNNCKLIQKKCCKNKNTFGQKQKINNKNNEINNISNLDLNHLNKSESEKVFNKRINKDKKSKTKLPSTNNTTTTIKKLIRNSSCKNFNKYNLKKNYNFENISKEEQSHDIGKYLINSQKFFEKVKNNKCQYYNEKNNYYIDTRRQRIEDNLNKQILEEYKILKPLRMTERKFYKGNKEKINNQQNEINISNNYNKCDKNLLNNKNLKMYYDKIKQISNSRKNLFIEEFFNDNRKKECDLLDFDFSFLYKKYNVKKNK